MNLKNKVTSLANIRGAMVFEFFSPGIPIILKNSGCEFIIFDMEHGGLSLEQFKTLATISSANNIFPLIRIPEVSYNYVARALDLGALGIMAPMVNSAEEAMKIVKSSKYPPDGVRGAGFGFAHDNYQNENPLSYINKSNKELVESKFANQEKSDDSVDTDLILSFFDANRIRVYFKGKYLYEFDMTYEQFNAFREILANYDYI